MPGIESLIYLVVYMLALIFVVSGVTWLIQKMKIPDPARWMLLILLTIFALLFLSHQLGLL